MPADYLSRLQSLPISSVQIPQISAFDPFTPDLQVAMPRPRSAGYFSFHQKWQLAQIPVQTKNQSSGNTGS
jgi:hypothetical protein